MGAKRESPFFPLYVDAFVSDEKLNECSALANGVYIRVLCLMHKSADYGRIRLEERDLEGDPVDCISDKLSMHLPFRYSELKVGVKELLDKGVLYVEDGCLCQKRMIKDAELSRKRSEGGKAGMAKRWSGKAGKQAKKVVPAVGTKATAGAAQRKTYNAADFEADLIHLGISKQTVTDWMANRRLKRLSPTKTAFEETKTQLLLHPEYTPEEQLRLAATKGWGGYKYIWFYNELNEKNNGNNTNNTAGAEPVQKATDEPRNYDEGF